MGKIYSIGYGNRTWDELKSLIAQRGCEFLLDVRSNPYSKYNPSFQEKTLYSLCKTAGIKYAFFGNSLGGKPNSPHHFDSDGKIDYTSLSKDDAFITGIERLINAKAKNFCICLMCSELRPEECHRCKLIGASLKERGVEIIHIDENGKDISQDDAIRKIDFGQLGLFGSSPEITRSRGVYGR